jgi:hypothetical protein
VRRILIAACLCGALHAPAHAQESVAQVPQSISRSAAATAPAQISSPTARDRTAVVQLPSGLVEREPARAAPVEEKAAPAGTLGVALSPPVRAAGSVDADEIARLLARGDAATIDAAAALALGATSASPQSTEDLIDERQMKARVANSHGLVNGDK